MSLSSKRRVTRGTAHLSRAALLLKRTFVQSVEDRVPKLAAALAYYMVFSLVPLLVIAIAVAGQAYGPAAARGEVARQIGGLVGTTAAKAIEATIRSAGRERRGAVATVVGSVVLMYGASVVFYDLQESLDLIWKVPARPRGTFWRAPRNWLISAAGPPDSVPEPQRRNLAVRRRRIAGRDAPLVLLLGADPVLRRRAEPRPRDAGR